MVNPVNRQTVHLWLLDTQPMADGGAARLGRRSAASTL